MKNVAYATASKAKKKGDPVESILFISEGKID